MKRGGATLTLVVVLSGGCSLERPEPVELQVGERRISVVIPEGWEHLDDGDRHQLRQGLGRISIEHAGGALSPRITLPSSVRITRELGDEVRSALTG